MTPLRSRDNPRVRRWHALAHDGRARRSQRRALIEGAHLLAAYLAAGGCPKAVLVSESGSAKPEIAGLVRRAAIEPVTLPDALLRWVADAATPTGLAAEISLPEGTMDIARATHAVFLDGVRQNEPDAAQVNFDLLPLEHVKRIELLSGSGSLLGPNSLGGAVNLITRRGEGPLEAELEVSAGAFDTYSAEGSVARRWRAWDYYVAGGYERARGWRQATLGENYNAFANVGRLGPTRGVSSGASPAAGRRRPACWSSTSPKRPACSGTRAGGGRWRAR